MCTGYTDNLTIYLISVHILKVQLHLLRMKVIKNIFNRHLTTVNEGSIFSRDSVSFQKHKPT